MFRKSLTTTPIHVTSQFLSTTANRLLSTSVISCSFRRTTVSHRIDEPVGPLRKINYTEAAKNKTPVPIDATAADWSIGGGSNSFQYFNRVGIKVLGLAIATFLAITMMSQPKHEQTTFLVDATNNLPSSVVNPTFTLQSKSSIYTQQKPTNTGTNSV